jgi:hypothetical protein
MRSVEVILLAGLAAMAFALPPNPVAQAQSAPSVERSAPADASAQRRGHRRATPVRIYGRALSPTAVRTCNSWYEQEYRPSGTVIVPRMRCHWVNG